MKITKRQLRRIIKEEKQKILGEVTPGERDEARRLSRADAGIKDDYHPRAGADIAWLETLEAVDELLGSGGRVTFEKGTAEDEVHIMTGAAEGITVKVLRRGR